MELKVGDRVVFRNGYTGIVVSDYKVRSPGSAYDFFVTVEDVDDVRLVITKDGKYWSDGSPDAYDVIEVIKEKEEKVMFKVGDRVRDLAGNPGKIVSIQENTEVYPVIVEFEGPRGIHSFTRTGKFLNSCDDGHMYNIVKDGLSVETVANVEVVEPF